MKNRPAKPLMLDGGALLQHYLNCFGMASQTQQEAEAKGDTSEALRMEGAAETYRTLFEGLKLALERAGHDVRFRIVPEAAE